MADPAELLFFDTFSHESSEELNLDLVQFPNPVYVTEVRIIPLGARVQADFPGGVRLGATNPSQFNIEFFVNDLGKPGASTFESLGGFEYNQNGCIHLECINNELNVRQIPTDGLVLRGWYTTITLAVYGTLTKNITEQVIQPQTNTPSITQQPTTLVSDVQQIVSANTIEPNWQQDVPIQPVPMEYNQQSQVTYASNYGQPENYSQDYHHIEYYNNEPPIPKDPRFHHTPESEWDQKSRPRDTSRPRECREDIDRDPDRHYSRSHSRERRTESRDRDWDRDRDRYKHQEQYKRSRDSSYGREEPETRKRPRTPPMASPKRPHTPHGEKELSPGDVESISEDEDKNETSKQLEKQAEQKKVVVETEEETNPMDLEQFEPILSDEDICDETEMQDLDYDFSAYSNNDDVIKLFNPLTTELHKYRDKSYIDIKNVISDKDVVQIINAYFANYNDQTNELISLLKSNKFGSGDFKNFSPELKEEFVHVSEQIPPFINKNQQYFNFVTLYKLVSEGKVTAKFDRYEELKQIQKTLLEFVNISLDFDFAFCQNQPGYKIRHMKAGIRLVEACCANHDFIDLLVQQNIHTKLLNLFEKQYMALSIKLLILRALDSCLSSDYSIEYFVSNKITTQNGYQTLINLMKTVTSVRIKFALNSLLTKVNTFELLKNIKSTVIPWCKSEISEEKIHFVIQGFDQILKLLQKGPFEISQPKRFLPVAAQFEISRSEEKNVLFNFFEIHQLLECILILLTHPKTNNCTSLTTIIYEFVYELLQSRDGLQFLSENVKSTNLLVKCFLNPEDLEAQYVLSEAVYIKSQSLGLNIAYKLQALYHVECLFDIGNEIDNNEVLDQLNSLYCLLYVNIGRLACIEVLSFGDNIKCLLQFLTWMSVDSEKKEYLYSTLKKSPGFGYIIDLIVTTVVYSSHVPFLERYGKQVLDIALQNDKFESSVAIKLNEILVYLKPLENANIFSYDDIKTLCEFVKNNLETVTNFSGELITALRILKHLGIANNNNLVSLENSNYNLVELKYKYVILQLFSLDGVQNLITILQKICEYYEQPNLHAATFSYTQGTLVINTILPCVQLIRQMLMNVIHCRNTEYKDLTAVPVLLQTFNLAHSFPVSSVAYTKSREVCKEIINTLLVYSQPVSDEISENDSLNKTLWTLMSGEVIKYITTAPHTFIPGLLIFSEILPLPLPFQTMVPLTDDEIKRAINLRKLWSAHLHSYSSSIQELINRLCTSLQQPLLHLLRRVCIQLSDLAANTAIMITRGVLDSVHSNLITKSNQNISCTAHTARLLHFLACLTTHGAIKCAVIQLFSHANTLKADEKYPSLVTTFCQVLKTQNESNSHLQAQECIVNIIQNLCDSEITLVQNVDSDAYLANSLPPKDILNTFLSTLFEHFSTENPYTTLLPIVRTFILLSEHDYGFYHLCQHFEKKLHSFLPILKKISNSFVKENAEYLQTVGTVLEFLRLSCDEMEIEGTILFTPRSMKLNSKELRLLVGWKHEEYENDCSRHPIYLLESLIKKHSTTEEPMENMLDNLKNIIRMLNTETESEITISEPMLQTADTLLGQFSNRPVYSLTEVSEEQLTTAYWLSAPSDEGGNEIDYVQCDLNEICRMHLAAEVSISREVEKLIRVFPQESDRQNVDQLKTKRSSEGQRNDKIKKPYVTPMRGRGFPRTAPQRGDLFRSRPPNTSRPPSLHVDDFVALETCGAQPTGPTGYNKLSRDLLNTRVVRSVRGRTFLSPERALHFRPL